MDQKHPYRRIFAGHSFEAWVAVGVQIYHFCVMLGWQVLVVSGGVLSSRRLRGPDSGCE
jgi:hypothetical protein